MKQSSRAWFNSFSRVLKSKGYKQTLSDHTLFVKAKGSKNCILIVYVDDTILTGDHFEEIERVKATLGKKFEVKDLDKPKYFLGMEVDRSRRGIYISKRKYILDLLTETDMLGCGAVETLIEVKKPKKKPKDKNGKEKDSEEEENSNEEYDKEKEATDKERYKKLVEKLIYLSHTRLDIAFAISVAIQYMSCPMKSHMEVVYKILRYLKCTPGKRLFFTKHEQRSIEVKIDASWGRTYKNQRSTFGYCSFVWGNLVTWRS